MIEVDGVVGQTKSNDMSMNNLTRRNHYIVGLMSVSCMDLVPQWTGQGVSE